MRSPNFFIIGAPKCGTTALHGYLRDHPRVFMSPLKEPHHFSDDLPGLLGFSRLEDYRALFAGATDEHRVIGESSAYYLASAVAVPRIACEVCDARLVVMVRNPLDMVASLHAQHLVSQQEDQPDLATAWHLQAERDRGERLPALCSEPRLLQYRWLAGMGEQLARAKSQLAPEQLHVVVFDDFQRETARVYAEVLAFLGLDHDGRRDFPRINANKRLRFPWLQTLINHRRVPESVRRVGRRVGLHKVQQWIRKANHRRTTRADLPAALRSELTAAFRDDVRLLSDLLRRDLTPWLEN